MLGFPLDLRSSLLALGIAQTSLALPSLTRSLHIPLERQFKADLHASATLLADPKVVHRLGVTLVGLLAIAIGLVPFLGHMILRLINRNLHVRLLTVVSLPSTLGNLHI